MVLCEEPHDATLQWLARRWWCYSTWQVHQLMIEERDAMWWCHTMAELIGGYGPHELLCDDAQVQHHDENT